MRLLSWNVQGKAGRLVDQAAHVVSAEPDIVCLQEVTARTAPQWAAALGGHGGLGEVAVADPSGPAAGVAAAGAAAAGGAAARSRPLLTLTAARVPLAVMPVDDVPWPERVLATRCDGLEIVNVHSPISSKPDLVKVRTHEAVHRHLAAASGARLVCGDLNTPRREHPDGRVWTFARDRYGRLDPERGERWDAAELALIKGLDPHGFRDAFRELHGLEHREPTWEWPRWGGGYRLDHLIVSAEVAVGECRYLHGWRKAGLSDHSPLLAELSWTGTTAGRLPEPAGGKPG